jgi:hypothetical protein
VFGHGRIGVRVAALVAYLRTTLRLPVRQVQTYLATLHELYPSVDEIVELAHDVREGLQGLSDQLLAQVRQQPVIHQDQTGWRENGHNGYVWATVSEGPAAVRTMSTRPAAAIAWRSTCWANASGAFWSAGSTPPTT